MGVKPRNSFTGAAQDEGATGHFIFWCRLNCSAQLYSISSHLVAGSNVSPCSQSSSHADWFWDGNDRESLEGWAIRCKGIMVFCVCVCVCVYTRMIVLWLTQHCFWMATTMNEPNEDLLSCFFVNILFFKYRKFFWLAVVALIQLYSQQTLLLPPT